MVKYIFYMYTWDPIFGLRKYLFEHLILRGIQFLNTQYEFCAKKPDLSLMWSENSHWAWILELPFWSTQQMNNFYSNLFYIKLQWQRVTLKISKVSNDNHKDYVRLNFQIRTVYRVGHFNPSTQITPKLLLEICIVEKFFESWFFNMAAL